MDIRIVREEDPASGQVVTRYLDSESLEEVQPPYYHLGTREHLGFPDEDFVDPRKPKKAPAKRPTAKKSTAKKATAKR